MLEFNNLVDFKPKNINLFGGNVIRSDDFNKTNDLMFKFKLISLIALVLAVEVIAIIGADGKSSFRCLLNSK